MRQPTDRADDAYCAFLISTSSGDNPCVSHSVASNSSIQSIEQRVAPLRARLANHPLYAAVRTLPQLRVFMESHVFAVWDFMALLKCLQRELTCVEVPWVPTAHPASRRFINEIVLGEESDEYEGRALSHFEVYLEAMRKARASTAAIERTVMTARQGSGAIKFVCDTLEDIPAPARDFVQATFRTIQHGSIAAQAAAFTFGREDSIPDMFRALVKELNREMGGDLAQFIWYLERHIEVDGHDHGPLSLRMVADLCGENPNLWEEAAQAAEDAVRARLSLWDGILLQLQGR
jgi:hypothetical protein